MYIRSTNPKDSVLRVEGEMKAAKSKRTSGAEPIRTQDENDRRNSSKRAHGNNCVVDLPCEQSDSEMNVNTIALLNNSFLPANYEADSLLQKVIGLVKNKEGARVSRLPSPWRERFNTFSVDQNNFLYRDERLVIPQSLRKSLLSAIHYGHPGRDAMLRNVSDIWWPRIHRDVVNTARCCAKCREAGKNLKTILKQKGGKKPNLVEPNEEIAIDFAGPFQNATHGKKYLLV